MAKSQVLMYVSWSKIHNEAPGFEAVSASKGRPVRARLL
jgi:hypothetical protein